MEWLLSALSSLIPEVIKGIFSRKEKASRTTIKARQRSTVVQLSGKGNSVQFGLGYSDVEKIATNIFKANFIELSQEAADLATIRAKSFVEKLLLEVNERHFTKFRNPDVQNSLYKSLAEYANSGDEHLGVILKNMLLGRLDTEPRELKQILYDEAISIAPKLTNLQLDVLTLLYLINQPSKNYFNSANEFETYLAEYFLPFLFNIPYPNAFDMRDQITNHFISMGCAYRWGGAKGLFSTAFRLHFQGILSIGFTVEEFKTAVGNITEEDLAQCLVRHFVFEDKFQLRYRNLEHTMNRVPFLQTLTKMHFVNLTQLIAHKTFGHKSRERDFKLYKDYYPSAHKIFSICSCIPFLDILPIGKLIGKVNLDVKSKSSTSI